MPTYTRDQVHIAAQAFVNDKDAIQFYDEGDAAYVDYMIEYMQQAGIEIPNVPSEAYEELCELFSEIISN